MTDPTTTSTDPTTTSTDPTTTSTDPTTTSTDPTTASTDRPRRSLLFMPGDNARVLEKAKGLRADGVIFDLEDAVSPDEKEDARERVCTAVASGEYGHREVVVRCNGLDTMWFADDVAAIAQVGPDALLVPKVTSVDDVRAVEQALEAAGAPDHTTIWVMLESPTAVLDARAIVSSTDRLTAVVVGTNDLAKDLRVEHVPGRGPMLTALSLLVLAVRGAGKVILDGVHGDLDDEEGFEAECHQGREFGFDGKTLIHPKQLEPCNRIFAPAEAEIDRARVVIAAFVAARREGRGVVSVDGRMAEALHVEQARDTLARAERIAAMTG